MTDVNGHEMSLSPAAELVCADLVARGAWATSGYRQVVRQAHVMAQNVCKITFAPEDTLHAHPILHRDWIGRTYRHGQALQDLLDEHPEWDTIEEIMTQFVHYLTDHPDVAVRLSHHSQFPCEVFDLDPDSVHNAVKARIAEYEREGVIVRVLWEEGGMPKCHVEVRHLPDNKVMEV